MDIPLKEARKLGVVNPYIRNSVLSAILDGSRYVNVSSDEYWNAVAQYNLHEEEKKALKQCAKLNDRGIAHEKAGKIKSAIKVYEQNILSEYPAHHSYKRLMVLYHKAKDYENEERVILRALYMFGNFPEYVDRLSKLISKLKK